VVIETAATEHTRQSLADGTDDVVLFTVTQGELLLLDDEGRVVGTENWRTAVDRYVDYCRAHGLEARDVTGPGA
jgi:DNA/RNA-binding domain of Phe-tRNA-synthetase-like protein